MKNNQPTAVLMSVKKYKETQEKIAKVEKMLDKIENIRLLKLAESRTVLAGIIKVSKAPLPSPNGYGKPLGNKNGNNLTGFFKIKYKGIGIRVVYTLAVDKMIMNIVVISPRDDNYCYDLAAKLYDKYGDDIFKDIFGNF